MDVGTAYASLTPKLCSILEKADIRSLQVALTSLNNVPGIKLGKKLCRAINLAKTSYDLFLTLEKSSSCNWLDIHLLSILANSSEQPAACELIKAYKKYLHSKKLEDVLSHFKPEVKLPYISKVSAKIDVKPNEITVGMLLDCRSDIENIILKLGKGKVKLKHARNGCLEIFCFIPAYCSFAAYKNALHNCHKFHKVCLLYLTCDIHPVIYNPWVFDLEEKHVKRKEVFHEHEGNYYL